jgi:hypothetical protein
MIVKKTSAGIQITSAGICSNNDISALTIANINYFRFQLMNSGPVTINWGDGNTTNLTSAQLINYNVLIHTYTTSGTYNIVITQPQNITALFFNGGSWNGDKITSTANWFTQFYNLTRLELRSVTFTGELSSVMEQSLPKLVYLNLYTASSNCFSINTANCINTFSRLTFLNLGVYYNITGSFSNINLNTAITYISIGDGNSGSAVPLTGNIDGIFKNGYTAATYFNFCVSKNITSTLSFDDFIIPDTLTSLYVFMPAAYPIFSLANFNFKNLTLFRIGNFAAIDLSNNATFTTFASRSGLTLGLNTIPSVNLTLDLSKITSTAISTIVLYNSTNGYNKAYGSIDNFINNFNGTGGLSIYGGSNDGLIYGTVPSTFAGSSLTLQYIDVTIAGSTIATLLAKTNVFLTSLPNATGTISACTVKNQGVIARMPNLYCDINTLTFGSWYTTTYTDIQLYRNPNFTGDLSTLPLFANKSTVYLNYCAYTGIPGFIQNIFTNRNTCLKAAGGYTTISVNNNADNSSLTGTLQQPALGSYTGNINDLTETQLTNLSTGLDYTGTGSTTAWTDKEKIWILVNLKNSSTDTSSRYRVSINY